MISKARWAMRNIRVSKGNHSLQVRLADKEGVVAILSEELRNVTVVKTVTQIVTEFNSSELDPQNPLFLPDNIDDLWKIDLRKLDPMFSNLPGQLLNIGVLIVFRHEERLAVNNIPFLI